MANAKIKLEDGTTIDVSGSADEIAKVLTLYGAAPRAKTANLGKARQNTKQPAKNNGESGNGVDLSAIANTINDCDDSDALEKYVLDKLDVMNRVLMCLYINDKYYDSQPQLTTGEISKILNQLGIPISTPNVSHAISRKAKSYVMADGVRIKGSIVRYSINRRGQKYFEELLNGSLVKESQNKQIRKPAPKPKKKAVKASGKDENQTSAGAKSSAPRKKSGTYKPKYNASLDLLGLGDFSASYILNNNSEYVVAFIKYLNEQLKIDSISGDEIYTCFSELKSQIKLPGSFWNTLRNAQNRDHLISYDKGFTNIELTPKGENLFHHDIMNRKKDDE